METAFLESERVALGETTFLTEYEGQFLAGGANALFDADLVASVTGKYTSLPASEGVGWVVGADFSFASDPTGLAVVGREKGKPDRLICAHVEKWQPRRTRHERRAAKSTIERQEVQDVVLSRCAELSAAYGHCPVVSDQHMSQVVRDGLKSRGVAEVYVQPWTAMTTRQAFQSLRSRMLADKISLPADKDLAAELLRIRTKAGSGQATIELPRTVASHCDVASALAAGCFRLEAKGLARPSRLFSAFTSAKGARVPVSNAAVDEMLSRPPVMGMR